MRTFRKHASWYLTGYPVGSEVRRRAAQVSSLAELEDLVGELDPTTTVVEGGERIRRGHTNGPIKVALPEGFLDDAGAARARRHGPRRRRRDGALGRLTRRADASPQSTSSGRASGRRTLVEDSSKTTRVACAAVRTTVTVARRTQPHCGSPCGRTARSDHVNSASLPGRLRRRCLHQKRTGGIEPPTRCRRSTNSQNPTPSPTIEGGCSVSLDIVIPAHNEEQRIDRTLRAYRTGFPQADVRFLVALDGCEDHTSEVVRAHAIDDERVVAARVPEARQGRRADGDVPPERRRAGRIRRRRLRDAASGAGPPDRARR